MAAPSTDTAELRRQAGLEVLGWRAFDSHPVAVAVTTRGGGVSAGPYSSLNLGLHVGDDEACVLENRRRAAAVLAASPDDMVFARQEHGAIAVTVSTDDRGRGALSESSAVGPADALVTRDPGVVLTVLVADCMPVVLYDPVAHVLACAHAGWRGTLAGVAGAALTAMQALGACPANVVAGLGPAIAPASYPVGADVVAAARHALGEQAGTTVRPLAQGPPGGHEQWCFDLGSANRFALLEAGVSAENIHDAGLPTGDGPGLFFSARADRRTGRFAAMAMLTSGTHR